MSLWSRQSIAVKLPVTLVLLLLAAFAAMAVASYFAMRQAVVELVAQRLERVKVNARRMGHLIDDLLSFSQVGRTPMVRQRVDMSELAQSVVDEAVRTAAPRAIEFTVERLPPAFGEPSLINQVLVNLVTNAVKFTGKRARAAVTIGARPDGDGATAYFVRDNGAGFDMRHADKLFGVFQRLRRLEDFEGTGVGLAIIDRVITRHGGRVWAEGKVDEGATFNFSLPANP